MILLINILSLELLRPFVYKTIAVICEKLNKVNIPLSITSPTELFKLSLCDGMGIGFLNVLSMYSRFSSLHRRSLVTLTSAGHNADYYMPQCDCISIYILTALECLFIMPMHVAWSYLTLADYSQKYRTVLVLVAVWHLATGACVSPVVRVSLCRRCSTECPMAASSLSSFSSSRLFSLSSSSHAEWLEALIC